MSSILRLGSCGSDVRSLQALLRQHTPGLAIDGVFGPRTERAVRLSQRRAGLYPPDGIAGPMTLGALSGGERPKSRTKPSDTSFTFKSAPAKPASAKPTSQASVTGSGDPGPLRHAVEPARHRALTNAMPAGEALPVASMRVSRHLRRFIIAHETQAGVSTRLHHPSMGSGVTIGPGYDMKDRSRTEVAQDLKAVGVDAEAAKMAAAGAGLSGPSARAFARDHKHLFQLSTDQEAELLRRVVGRYEAKVKRAVSVPLHQQEYDALVSYAYNPGGGWRVTTGLVNKGQHHAAMLEIKRHVYSKGQLIRSLVRRRAAESRMFLYGEYN